MWSSVSECNPLCVQVCEKTYLPSKGALPSLCSSLFSLLLTVAPPVFSRPNWPCRSSWPRVWQLASCPAPSPHQLCARWQPTHWLYAIQWAPPPSSRPPSLAPHCFGLPQGRCGPHTHPSSFLLTKDLTSFPFDLHPLSLYQTTGPPSVWPTWQRSHANYAAHLTYNGKSAQVLMLRRPLGLWAVPIIKAKIPHHAFFLLLLSWPKGEDRPPDSDWCREATFTAISWVNMVWILDIIV